MYIICVLSITVPGTFFFRKNYLIVFFQEDKERVLSRNNRPSRMTLRSDFNALLLALREAGLMREPPGDAT